MIRSLWHGSIHASATTQAMDVSPRAIVRLAKRILEERRLSLIAEAHSPGLERAHGILLTKDGRWLRILHQHHRLSNQRPAVAQFRWLTAEACDIASSAR